MNQSNAPDLRIVAHQSDGTLIKGFTSGVPDFYAESLDRNRLDPPPNSFPIRLAGTGDEVNISIQDLKALYFVKSFDGLKQYTEVKFFKSHPVVEGLWVRLRFNDQESTEGVVHNSAHFILNSGFFLKPPDPHSNNQLVYVLKSSLTDFRVLGVRGSY